MPTAAVTRRTSQGQQQQHQPKRFTLTWRFFLMAVVVTAVIPLVLHMRVPDNHDDNSMPSDGGTSYNFIPRPRRAASAGGAAKSNNNDSKNMKIITFARDPFLRVTATSFEKIINAANQAESEILKFFHGEPRALRDGVPYGGDDDGAAVNKFLTKRLIHRIAQCHQNNNNNNNNDKQDKDSSSLCILKVVFIGSGQTTGRDNFFNETYPFFAQHRLQDMTEAAGLQLEVYNHAMDSDLSREGPQSTHMCIQNLVGDDVDIIVWDMDGNMQANPAAQVEAFVRWSTVLTQPAMIIMNKGGPHGRSRRGKKRLVVNLGPGHDAMVYEDDLNDMPKQRQEVYRESSSFRDRWQKGRNQYWEKVFEKYAPFVDFAAVDPEGSIWHLDHLLEFSNQAFDGEKALPLVDCGPMHPPPCDQIPDFVQNHLARANLTIDNIPKSEIGLGAVCLAQLGCRHLWYGGKRSHNLRGELNALPILRAIRDAARALQRDSSTITGGSSDAVAAQGSPTKQQRSLISMTSLPPPEFCKATFCGTVAPRCITSYIPNLGTDLGDAIRPTTTTTTEVRPRKGACHFLDDPIKQVRNLDLRFSPLGYIDRKYAYRLSVNDPNNNNKKHEQKKDGEEDQEDASTTTIVFSTTTTGSSGPLVLCEPPCFIDSCSKNRKMPFIDHVTMELDGKKVDRAKVPQAVEVGGPFCKVVTGSVEKGEHTLRISTNVVSPQHVMFSALIPFS